HNTPLKPKFVNDIFDKLYRKKIDTLIESGKLDSLISRGQTIVSAVVMALFHMLEWLLMFIYIIFIMLYYDEISTGFKKIAPRKYRKQVMTVINDVKDAMNHYFRGQGLMALCAMVLYSIGFSIVGLPMAIIMGITVGTLYMIPYFQYVTIIPVAIICFITSLGGEVSFWSELAKCLLVYVFSQTICDYILTPRVLGKAMGLNPAIILLALSVWGSLLGILGMLIALPATAVIFSYYERYISNR
ncbi:MAG: AI-2E family transporter, partial [Muribaculaceae bacterium]|nr:AI-2E family transporter [Muribaculaceae bacterium]